MIVRGWVAEIRSADGAVIERLDRHSNALKPPELGHVFSSKADALAAANQWTGWARRVYRIKRTIKRPEPSAKWTLPTPKLYQWHL